MARGKQHLFSEIPRADIQRSSFDRSHGYKTTFDAGYLIPAFVDEVLPADTFILKLSFSLFLAVCFGIIGRNSTVNKKIPVILPIT